MNLKFAAKSEGMSKVIETVLFVSFLIDWIRNAKKVVLMVSNFL
jgi:hypothetical protein